MCGIAGLWNWYHSPGDNEAVLRSMMDAMVHRGPDAQTMEVSRDWAVGHVRLSIVDVAGGGQPIFNEDGTRFVAGNNEIYNAPELRRELTQAGHRFSTLSDTEVALHAWEEWGDDCFRRFNGMFALVLVDTKAGVCVLARDGMGIKPMHFLRRGNQIAFASEIKSLLQIPDAGISPDFDSVHLFMNFRYVPTDDTLFAGVKRVSPGSFVRLNRQGEVLQKKFFNLPSDEASPPGYGRSVDLVRDTLTGSVRRHLLADVEVASYLSGGIDSSAISALAARDLPSLRTYCLGFGEPTDENADAKRVAERIGSRHSELFIGESPLDRYEQILWHVEEPKVNLMQGYALAELVSRDVKVALSGLGGDELFAGYVNNDILFPMTLLSRLIRSGKTRGLGAWQKFFSARHDVLFRAGELALNIGNPLAFYAILRNTFDHDDSQLRSLYASPPAHWKGASLRALSAYFDPKASDVMNEVLRLEARTKLVNDFLLTEDRVSMAHSLEVRVPFLDKELVELAFRLPSRYKYVPGGKKRILKDASEAWLPRDVLEKKKWGFSINPHLLFEKQLKHFAREVLTEKSVRELGLFSWPWIEKVLSAPSHPRMRWHYFNVWVMAGFHLWHQRFFKDICPKPIKISRRAEAGSVGSARTMRPSPRA